MKLAQDVLKLVGGPLDEVEEGIRNALSDASTEAQKLTLHLTESGGKRVRPILALLAARLFAADIACAVPVGVASELIHMATLVHDDVIDRAATRRGRKTVNYVWGNHISVLAGDALLAKALVILVDGTEPAVVRIMSEMIYRMCEGEIAQHASLRDIHQSQDDYFARIEKKTALFFGACCQAGGLVAGATGSQGEALWRYGRNMGMAFQVIDDLLDVSAKAQVVGKPVGHDVESGVLTLPVLQLLQDERYEVKAAELIRKGDAMTRGDIERLLAWVRETGALEYTYEAAEEFSQAAKAALAEFPDSPTRRLMFDLADSVLTRKY